MAESDNLRTASLYINNQLLSRGLLRNGQNIDFSDPETGAGGLQATMGRVMSVVNDLILRRDRDAVHRESLSNTLLGLRAEVQRQTTESNRQADRFADTQRKLDIAEATERALRTQLKATETNALKLKDEMVKMKTFVAQSRAACANEVRKRDRQIDGLKKAVTDAGRVRGGGRNSNVLTISVTGDVGAEGTREGVARGGTEDDGYSLRMETNEFLTELARGLSDENSALLDIVRRMVDELRDMSGMEGAPHESIKAGSKAGESLMLQQRTAEDLAAELEGIMEHLRTILTNPSFVPIEEVELRDSEIARLREGWERMESRWKDAVHMIDGWRRRMASGGKTVNMEELQMGLRLSPVRVREIAETVEIHEAQHELSCVQEEDEEEDISQLQPPKSPSPVESLHLVPAPGYEGLDEADMSDTSSIFQDDVDIEDFDAEEPNVQILQESTATSMGSPPLPVPPQLSPLKDSYSSGNRGSGNAKHGSFRKKPGDFTTIVEENTYDLAAADEPPLPPPHVVKPQSPKRPNKLSAPSELQEQLKPSSSASYDSPLFGDSLESPLRANPNRKLFSKPSAPVAEAEQVEPPRSQPVRDASPVRSKRTKPEKPDTAKPNLSPDPAAKPTSTKPAAPAKRTASDPTPAAQTEQPVVQPTSKSTTQVRNRSPVRPPTSSRLPRLPRPANGAPPQSPLTMAAIASKLAASERDADAARVRAKLKAARAGRRQNIIPSQVPLPEDDDEEQLSRADSGDPVKKGAVALEQEKALRDSQKGADAIPEAQTKVLPEAEATELKPEKRKRERRPSKVASRRRSTLSPWELESLITGSVNVESPAR